MKILKPLIFSVVAIAVAVLSSVASYFITSNILKKQSYEAVKNKTSRKSSPAAVSVQAEKQEGREANALPSYRHYSVKLDGDKINVYVNFEEHKEILYSLEINPNDLSEEDLKLLSEGMEFDKMSELTEFTENFAG